MPVIAQEAPSIQEVPVNAADPDAVVSDPQVQEVKKEAPTPSAQQGIATPQSKPVATEQGEKDVDTKDIIPEDMMSDDTEKTDTSETPVYALEAEEDKEKQVETEASEQTEQHVEEAIKVPAVPTVESVSGNKEKPKTSTLVKRAEKPYVPHPTPRTVIALYDSKYAIKREWSMLHMVAEMPLNHLGLVLEFHDVRDPVPDLAGREDVRGIISWLDRWYELPNHKEWLEWAVNAMEGGKKFVVMNSFGMTTGEMRNETETVILAGRFFELMGLYYDGNWVSTTYDVIFTKKDRSVVEFEREYKGILEPYAMMRISGKDMQSYLVAQKRDLPQTESHLVVTGPRGGYVADGYAVRFVTVEGKEIRQWLIDPFEFFRRAFQTDTLPKPDTTTMAGRRIYYSHIDGDGWNNITQLEQYAKRPVISAQVVMDYAIKPYDDLPVSVGPITAEIDPAWVGLKASSRVAEKLLALPQVEAASHTYTHPFYWKFFKKGGAEKESRFLSNYVYGDTWQTIKKKNKQWFLTPKPESGEERLPEGIQKEESDQGVDLPEEYTTPRAYAHEKFSLDKEITGAAEYMKQLMPKDKKVEVLLWSGDTQPYEAAIAKTREAGLRNLNGGDSRFDPEYPSYAWVTPMGRRVGKQLQIYSSNSNENTYTELWTDRFYGFRFLTETFENTESPIRVKPMNLYYHMYSGEKQASLYALLKNIDYVRSHEVTPITASRYAAVGDGFFSTRLMQVGPQMWEVYDRDGLETIRFDHAEDKQVDFMASRGVVGQRYYQRSLYVYLDESEKTPRIALKENPGKKEYARAEKPYLIDSRWRICNLKWEGRSLQFSVQGFGMGAMRWWVPENGIYVLMLNEQEVGRAKVEDNILQMELPYNTVSDQLVTIKLLR
ncbi:MAG: hypothetical protein KDD76_00730 [Rickettsiales bacterium]|nr:hypothetical protein [Rickettsiales bacterium]